VFMQLGIGIVSRKSDIGYPDSLVPREYGD
jgi:hypothetical protein